MVIISFKLKVISCTCCVGKRNPFNIYIILVFIKALKENFEEAEVEVVDCPDLKEEPFTLAAPGKNSLRKNNQHYLFKTLYS